MFSGKKNGGWKKQIGPIAAQKDRATINLSTCLLVNCQSNCERTYGPCVPTCTQTNRAISHVTCQYGHDSSVGTHGSCVRSWWNETQIRWLLDRTHGPCVPTLFKLIINDLHPAFQSQPFCCAIWLKSPYNMAEIAR